MDEHDRKQHQLIESYIKEFENGKLKIDRLISVLDGLIESLQITNEDWKDRFRSEWWTLEQVYSVAIDRKETSFSPESQNLINESIANMKLLLQEIKQSYANQENSEFF
jgi:hypothetical protein